MLPIKNRKVSEKKVKHLTLFGVTPLAEKWHFLIRERAFPVRLL